jgi:hypothetical protein|eukprot:COSAG06_NODE_3407_length_5387_cov_6.329236_7_plen_52_part_00
MLTGSCTAHSFSYTELCAKSKKFANSSLRQRQAKHEKKQQKKRRENERGLG